MQIPSGANSYSLESSHHIIWETTNCTVESAIFLKIC